ncbi:hypothetical protein A2U01_0095902 [Trifolium medium]|uniref:Uncharacterized protein n=1 Tax=Trifolium medium TaxID=97028 RepID=A0A392UP31_9FABA|nr:hypothetical protein [Trifolium medium]
MVVLSKLSEIVLSRIYTWENMLVLMILGWISSHLRVHLYFR